MVILQYQSGNAAFVNCIRDSRFCKQIEWFQRLAWWPQGSSISHHVVTFKGILMIFFSLSPESLTGQPTNPSRGLMESLPPNISIKLDLKFWVPLLLRVFKSCLKQICPGFYWSDPLGWRYLWIIQFNIIIEVTISFGRTNSIQFLYATSLLPNSLPRAANDFPNDISSSRNHNSIVTVFPKWFCESPPFWCWFCESPPFWCWVVCWSQGLGTQPMQNFQKIWLVSSMVTKPKIGALQKHWVNYSRV